jgi:hypothetical protein
MRSLALVEIGGVSGGLMRYYDDDDYGREVGWIADRFSGPHRYALDSNCPSDVVVTTDEDGNDWVGPSSTVTTFYPDGTWSNGCAPNIRFSGDQSSGSLTLIGNGIEQTPTPTSVQGFSGGISIPANIWSPDYVPSDLRLKIPPKKN